MLYNVGMNNLSKHTVRFALSAGIVASLFVPALASAHEDATTSTTSTTATTTASNDTAARTTRIEAYKKSLKETLTAAAKTRITEKCSAAQVLVKAKVTSNTAVATARHNAYDKIVDDLEDLQTAATAKGANVAALTANIAALKVKVAAFTTANSVYQSSLSDLSLLDCKTDPTAFKAALESARTNQAAVLVAAKDVRTYLTDTVKPSLVALKTAMSAKTVQ